MQKSTNYGLNLPDLADQYNLEHWNENTEKLDLELKKETDSRINNDNQLQSNINNSVSTLRNEISTAETNAKNLANATGVLSIAKGGTGATDAKNGFMNLANSLTQSESPLDTEYMIYKNRENWGLYTLLQFWEYIKGKISSVLGLTATQYNGNAKTATNAVSANTATSTKCWSTENSDFEGNLNDLEIGKWYCVNVSKNMSFNTPNINGWISVITFAAADNPFYKQQLCICSDTSAVYTRTCLNNAWYNWEKLEMSYESRTKNMVHTCSTDARTASKTVSARGFTLTTGACIRVLFTNGNNIANPTLNVNDTGAKEIRCQRGELSTSCTSSSDISKQEGYGVYSWDSYTVLDLYYDARYDDWVVLGDPIVKRFYSSWNPNEMYNVSITGISWLGFLCDEQK